MKTPSVSLARIVSVLTVLTVTSHAARGGYIESYVAAKARFYSQSSTGAPVLATNEGPYLFHADVKAPSTYHMGPFSSGAVISPSNSTNAMELHDEDSRLELNTPYSSESALNAAFVTGNYTFKIKTTNNVTATLTMNLGSGSCPPAPHINNYAAAQAINPAAAFRLTWDSLAGTATRIGVSVRTVNDDHTIYETADIFDKTGFLSGAVTNFDIPAYTLAPGTNYMVQLIAAKVTATNTTSYPEAYGYAGYASLLQFNIRTTGTPDTTPPTLISSSCNNGAVTLTFSERMNTNEWYFSVNGYPNPVSVSNYRWSADYRTMYYNVTGTAGTMLNMGLYGLTDVAGNQLPDGTYLSLTLISSRITPAPYALVNSGLTCTAVPEYVQFQWQRNGTNVPGATMSNYCPTVVGTYRAVAKNAYGNSSYSSATSSAVTVVATNQTKQIFLQNTNGMAAIWYYYGTNFVSSIGVNRTIPAGWQIAAQADFNRDGQTDLLLQKGSALSLWTMFGGIVVKTNNVNYAPPTGTLIASAKDYPAGRSELLRFNPTTPNVCLLQMTNFGTTLVKSTSIHNNPSGWKPVAMADFFGTADNDIIWQNTVGTNRQAKVWYGTNFVSETFMFGGAIIPTGWDIAGAVDLTGDGQKDLVLQSTSGQVALWIMSRNVRTGIIYPRGTTYRLPAGWKVVGPR